MASDSPRRSETNHFYHPHVPQDLPGLPIAQHSYASDPPLRRRRTSTTSSFSTASSITSISSFARSATSSRSPPTMSEASGAYPRLQPCKDTLRGFMVELPGGQTWIVTWGELIGLLMKPEATHMLPEPHLARRLSEFLRNSRSTSHLPLPHESDGRSQANVQASPLSPPVSGFRALNFNPSEQQSAMYGGPSYTQTQHQQLPQQHHSAVPTTSPASLPSFHDLANNEIDGRRRSFITPLQKAFLPEHTNSYQAPLPPPSQPPPPPPVPTPPPFFSQLNTSQKVADQFDNRSTYSAPTVYNTHSWAGPKSPGKRDFEGRERFVSPHREMTRRMSQPYPQASRPPSVHSSYSTHSAHSTPSSVHSVQSGHSTHSSHSSTSNSNLVEHSPTESKPRVPRALNSRTETYLWSSASSQLYRITPGQDPGPGEVITFPPGSYHKVIKEDLEVLPCEGKGINDWLRGQQCVTDCRFRFERKRPATIRAHFIACKLRIGLKEDPIRRLCELQTAAQRRFRTPSIFSPMGWPLPPNGDNASFISDSSGHWGEDDHSSLYDDPPSSMYDAASTYDPPEPFDSLSEAEEDASEEAIQAAAAMGRISSESYATHPWLANYGLQEPTGEPTVGVSTGLPDRPFEAASSFLSMDEDP